MIKQLHLLLLLLSFTMFSCKDEEEPIVPKKLRISSIRELKDNSQLVFSTHSFMYNDAGQVDEDYSVKYSYNSNKLLSSMLLKGGGYKEDYAYDATGRMVRVNFSNGEKPNETPFGEYRFIYDGLEHISRMEGGLYGQQQGAIILSYDLAGNVNKLEGFDLSLSGELSSRVFTIEVSYDSQVNPFKGMGSSITRYYMHSAVAHNLPYFLSPNNPVEATYTIYNADNPTYIQNVSKDQFSYKYNEEGFPVEVRYSRFLFKLDYSFY